MHLRMLALVAVAVAPLSMCQPNANGPGMCDGKTPDEWRALGKTVIVGTPNKDTLKGTAKDEVIFGREGNDNIQGGGGNDILCGNQGMDTLKGGKGNDRIFGGLNDDSLAGGGGSDFIDGGDNSDVSGDYVTYKFAGAGVRITYDNTAGTAKVSGTTAVDQLRNIEQFQGSAHDDKIDIRDTSAQQAYGGDGDDKLRLDARDKADGDVGDDDCYYNIHPPAMFSCDTHNDSGITPGF